MLKELRKLAYLSMALVAISYGSQPASAAVTLTSAGACTGAAFSSGGGADCVTTTGHISASVVSTLSINELRAVSFGNMAMPCGGAACTGADATIALAPATGVRTYAGGTDTIILLRGVSANDGAAGNSGALNSGGQSPGILEVKGAFEDATSGQVYISFADNAGNPVDYSGEDYWSANDTNIHLVVAGGTAYFTVKDFTIDCPGSTNANDVYGHYCAAPSAAALQVKVGATLSTAAQTYTPGKYTGTYNAMVSY